MKINEINTLNAKYKTKWTEWKKTHTHTHCVFIYM